MILSCYFKFGDTMKEFKAKKVRNKKKKVKKIRLVIFTFFFFFAYVFVVKYLSHNKLKDSILDEHVNYINFDIKKMAIEKVDEVINAPDLLLNKVVKEAKPVKLETKKTKVNNKQNKNVEEKSVEKQTEPIIYIYNTHQTENYENYTVYDAASFLNSKLNSMEFTSYFEEQSVKVFLEQNGLKYYKSYKASRTYLDQARSNYPSIKYFFDIHRDSVSKSVSTSTYKNKNYAKVLFVIGLDNPGNELNYNNANKLNEIIKSKVPNISRGIVRHGGKGYNGIYNQDVSEQVFLIEIGGKDNTKEEVVNTLEVIYESILEYVRGVV